MPSYEASMRNLAIARTMGRCLRPWRSNDEAYLIRRFVFEWLSCPDLGRPSARAWARALGVSHTWVQKLVRRFQADPSEMQREAQQSGDPSLAQLSLTREYSRQMRERGELRSWKGANRLILASEARFISFPVVT